MFESRNEDTTFRHYLLVAARATGSVAIAVILLFLLGEVVTFRDVSIDEWVGFAFFPAGVIVGLILALREEFLGGAVTLASIAGFYLIYGWLLNGSFSQGTVLIMFAVPATLFVFYGLGRGATHRSATP